MNEPDDIIKDFNTNVDEELALCQPAETPRLCAQLTDPANYEKLKKLIMNKVVQERINIGEAIVAIEAELDPNALD